VSTFGLLLSFRNGSQTILFEPTQRVVSDKIFVYSADALSIEELFRIGIDELPKAIPRNRVQKIEVIRNKIIVNINASDLLPARRYSVEGFAEIIRELNQHNSNLKFVLIGSESENNYVERLIQSLKNIPVANMAGHLSFADLANEFAGAALVLSGDSMPLHLAAYLEVPVVALWGPTQPAHFGYSQMKNIHSVTLNLSCSPCFIHPSSKPARHCKGRIDCLSQLRSHQVSEICKDVLANTPFERMVNFSSETEVALKPKFAFE
jgi:ADP-heptose:LPS heptosyltransferase